MKVFMDPKRRRFKVVLTQEEWLALEEGARWIVEPVNLVCPVGWGGKVCCPKLPARLESHFEFDVVEPGGVFGLEGGGMVG